MNPEGGKQWERFLEYAALARAKPTFDTEEREWKLLVADRMKQVLRAARDGGDWLPLLNAVYRQGDLLRMTSAWSYTKWFNAWAGADPESARQALTTFLDPAPDAEDRFRSFARAVEEAEARGTVTADPNTVLRLGSACNFAVDPLSLPMVQPGQFRMLERILGYERSGSANVADAYAAHLDFARLLRARMEEHGVLIHDMIDVQSLISIAARERDFWSGDRLYAIGVPPPAEQRPAPRDDGPAPRSYLSVCAIYRDEADYLAEWIEFHRLVGVERFYLYDNLSVDHHREVLAPYVDRGIAVLHHWPIPRGQFQAYDDCLNRHGHESRWIAFIDCDEFLFSPTGRSLPEVLVDYEPWPGVGVNWALFGRSGHIKKPPGLVIENYVMRVLTAANAFTKSIVDPARAVRARSAHQFEYQSLLAVDENHYPIQGASTKSISFSRLRINHYATKSEEESRAKLDSPKGWTKSGNWRSARIEDELPQELDEIIAGYIPALRAAMASPAAGRPSQLAPRT